MNKPGWKTTEFLLTALTCFVGLAQAGGFFADSPDVLRYLGLAAAGLASLGYSFSRGIVKHAQVKNELAISSNRAALAKSLGLQPREDAGDEAAGS